MDVNVKDSVPRGTCGLCRQADILLVPVTVQTAGETGFNPDRDDVLVEHTFVTSKHRKVRCPGSGRVPEAEKIEGPELARSLVPHVDYVRLHGFGNGIFSVRGRGTCPARKGMPGREDMPAREWLDVYGPLDEFGHPEPKAKLRSVEFLAVKAKVRNPPPPRKRSR